jgi:CBS domain-containing protein
MNVRDIMTAPAVTCYPHTSLAMAARLMRDADYGTVVVVDHRGALAGIVTDRDVCVTLAGTNRNAINVSVHEAMTARVFFARLDDDVRRALMTMRDRRVRRLPVCDAANRPVGMLSIEDVVVRGIDSGSVDVADLVGTLRAMYIRVPVPADAAAAGNGFTPG